MNVPLSRWSKSWRSVTAVIVAVMVDRAEMVTVIGATVAIDGQVRKVESVPVRTDAGSVPTELSVVPVLKVQRVATEGGPLVRPLAPLLRFRSVPSPSVYVRVRRVERRFWLRYLRNNAQSQSLPFRECPLFGNV